MGKYIDFTEIQQSELINERLKVGTIDNKYAGDRDVCKPAPASNRVDQLITHMFTVTSLPDPVPAQQHLQDVAGYSYGRQARYFGAWALDQGDHFVEKMKHMPVRLEESQIREYKQEIIAALHHDFESGEAMKYADEWYMSFPNGGYFNPARYERLYEDEKEIADMVSEYMLCGYGRSPIASLLAHGKHLGYNRAFVDAGGAFMINYKTGSGIRDMLASKVIEISDSVSETIGEDEVYIGLQRIFVTEECDFGTGFSGCAVLYAGFDTMKNISLITHVKNAIISVIPEEVWKEPNQLDIISKPLKVTVGEIDMAKKYLRCETANAYQDKKVSQEEPEEEEDFYFM